jgi:tetratricopeptide (TPR) repeat protein
LVGLANNIWFGADEEASKRGEEEAARRALEIDPTDSEAHAMMGEVYGYKGQFDLAAAEFERALTLNPSDTVSLGLFLFWSAAVGQAEKGAEAADRLIRLDPNYETFTGQAIAYAYFMVGRYEDTLRVLSRIPDESLRLLELVNVAASYAALGHEDRAKAAVAKTLERFPDLTIQGYLSDVGWSEAERERLLDTMRRAGFALCEKNVSQPDLLRLPECPNPQAS